MVWCLTEHLLSLSPDEYKAATQAPFLLAAGEGRLPKDTLGKWLANDRLYIHAYIRAVGQLLASLDLPKEVSKTDTTETRLVDWLIDALAGVRREERFFIEVASRYGLDVELGTTNSGIRGSAAAPKTSRQVPAEDKLPGLVMIEKHFGTVGAAQTSGGSAVPVQIPWLEGAVMFWATERCYLDAWSWAKSRQALIPRPAPREVGAAAAQDADGGALRKEFIPNWSSPEFAGFVNKLGDIIDDAVAQTLEALGEDAKKDLLARVEGKWKSFMAAEAAFWPDID